MTEKQWPNSKKPSDSPSKGLIALLQVLQWGIPTIKYSARLLLIAVPLHAVILLLWWVAATN